MATHHAKRRISSALLWQRAAWRWYGGETGIRTLGDVAATHAFQACQFNHSCTSPYLCIIADVGWGGNMYGVFEYIAAY